MHKYRSTKSFTAKTKHKSRVYYSQPYTNKRATHSLRALALMFLINGREPRIVVNARVLLLLSLRVEPNIAARLYSACLASRILRRGARVNRSLATGALNIAIIHSEFSRVHRVPI